MGKQSKRPGRKKAQDRLKRIEKNRASANALENPLAAAAIEPSLLSVDIPSMQAKSVEPGKEEDFNPNLPEAAESSVGTNPVESFEIQYFASPLPSDLHNACMKLFEENMGDMYKNSDWGLDLEEKAKELLHENARFLLVVGSTPNDNIDTRHIAAFCHFRFDTNDDDQPTEEVLYVHELQVCSRIRRLGLGKRLMDVAEQVAARTHMRKVMLTVFLTNHPAMAFYTNKLHYTVDDSSPSKYGETVDYEILSKKIESD